MAVLSFTHFFITSARHIIPSCTWITGHQWQIQNTSQAVAQRRPASDNSALCHSMSTTRTSKRSRKSLNILRDAMRSDKMLKRRADIETAALTGSYTIDDDSDSGSEEPKKRIRVNSFSIWCSIWDGIYFSTSILLKTCTSHTSRNSLSHILPANHSLFCFFIDREVRIWSETILITSFQWSGEGLPLWIFRCLKELHRFFAR